MSTYPRGSEFPHEHFVQKAIEAHFDHLGFTRDAKGHCDLVVFHPQTKDRWIIEAKGETSDTGLDFRTGLG